MQWLESPTAILLRTEWRALLRDRRTIFASVILPILILPLMLFAGQFSERGREERLESRTYQYTVIGDEAAWARELIATMPLPEREDGDSPVLQLEEIEVEDAEAALEAQELHFYVEARSADSVDEADSGDDEDAADGAASSNDPDGTSEDAVKVPQLALVFSGDWDLSSSAMGEMSRRLRKIRTDRREALLQDAGFALSVDKVLAFEDRDVASQAQRSGAAVGRFAVLYVLLFMLTGGSVVAADTIAGEKERGTLETLLTTAIKRSEIVTAKQLLIILVGIGIALIQLLNFFVYIKFDIIELPESFAVDLSGGQILLLTLLFLPLAALTSSILLWLSGRSQTYKEFQIAFFPVFLLCALPAAMSVLPGISLRSAIVLLPIANISVAVKEILVGEIDLPMIGLAFAVTSFAAWWALGVTRRTLSEERLTTANTFDKADLEGGPALFPRHVPRWFALMWALIFIAALNEVESLRMQILFNVVLVFFGGSLLMIQRYRLPVREALALRPVKPVIWLAVLLGAPSALIANMLVVKFSALVFPVPEAMLEEMARTFTSDNLGLWQSLFWIALIPGICEEVAFRGVLLHGLRKRFSPLALCLITGAVFGLFHFNLMRLLPTGILGVLLGALTLLTGSIYPAMVWHALNNAVAILAQSQSIPLEDMSTGTYVMAVAVVILAGALIWRNRSMYPDLKTLRPARE